MPRRSSRPGRADIPQIPDQYELPYLTRTRTEDLPEKLSVWSRVRNSFKRAPGVHYTTAGTAENEFDMVAATAATARSRLQRKLKARHLQMISIGGSIGGFSNYDAIRLMLEIY